MTDHAKQLLDIARRHFPTVQTLATRNSDPLDFHDVSVWAIEAALEEAYQAGRGAAAVAVAPAFCDFEDCDQERTHPRGSMTYCAGHAAEFDVQMVLLGRAPESLLATRRAELDFTALSRGDLERLLRLFGVL